MTPRLVLPNEEYLDSYLEACRGYKQKGVTLYRLHDPDEYEHWRHTIFQGYEDYRNGVNLRPGHVPETVFWMIEDGAYVGNGNLRHRLTEELLKKGGHIGYAIRADRWGMGYGTLMLQLLLEEAAKLGIDRALVTCDEGNIASARVMEKNGGVCQDTIDHVVDGISCRIKRYWIDAPVIRNQTSSPCAAHPSACESTSR